MRQPGPRVSPLFFPSPSMSLCSSRDALVPLPSPSYSCLLFNGARRCSLIDGTGHSRAAKEEKKKRGRREAKSESDEEREEGRPLRADHHRLIYNAGGVTEFTIKIPRSAALMDRRARRNATQRRRRLWYFQMNPPLFPS